MNHTKAAIAAVAAMTTGDQEGLFGILTAMIRFACSVYVLWYVLRGPDPAEHKERA